MSIYVSETIWLNETEVCTLQHIEHTSGLSLAELQELVNCGLIEPASEDPAQQMFHLQAIVVARTARRLRDDFELNSQGMVLALNLLRRIQVLEAEIARIPK